MRTLILTLLILVSITSLSAQEEEQVSPFSLFGYAGTSWGGSKRVPFTVTRIGSFDIANHPGASFGFGIEYGPILRVEGTLFSTAIEAAYGQEGGTSPTTSHEARIQRVPIMAWLRAKADTRFSPFVQVGFGTASTRVRETSSLGTTFLDFHRWTFVYGAGGGVSYRITPHFAVEVFIETWISQAEIVERDPALGTTGGFEGTYTLDAFGVRACIAL